MSHLALYYCVIAYNSFSYVLERHLKRDEVIYPLTELGKFRGEPVYARSSVIPLKTAENWMRQGRKVKEGCQPMKWVKQRAVTVNKKRAIEVAMGDRYGGGGPEDDGVGSEKDVMQGLYSQSQTELYKADPVVDVSVFLFQPSPQVLMFHAGRCSEKRLRKH